MKYFIEIGKTAQKQIEWLDKRLRINIEKKIEQLKYNPTKGKHLFKNFYELKAKNYRIYYSLFRGIIVIEKVYYSGKIVVRKVGTKNRQKQDVRRLK